MSNQRTPKAADRPDLPKDDGDDTEGHNLWISPSVSREMANSRSRDIEREARERQRAKEARERR
jgi:hypothetical protein